jgi:integrase
VTTAAPPAAVQPRPSQLAADGIAVASSNGDWPRSRTDRAAIAGLASALPVGSQLPKVLAERRYSAGQVLAWLESLPGQTWQQRWEASGCEALGRDWTDVPAGFFRQDSAAPIGPQRARRIATCAIHALLCLDVIRPGYRWLLSCQLKSTYEHVRRLRDPDWCAQADAICQEAGHRMRNQLDALMHLSRIMLHTGRGPRELTTADLLAYHRAVTGVRQEVCSFALTWDLMRQTGVFPAGTPSLGNARARGQRTVAEMVDRYELACQPVRDVLVRYLSDRAAAVDHSTLRGLAGKLAGAFWKDLEEHHPGIDSLHLAPQVAQAWRQRAVRWRGRPDKAPVDKARVDHYGVLFTVRAFYLDIGQWALEDPSWVPWAVPSPVRLDDVRGAMKNKRHRVAKMHQRTRTLAPLLPQLVHSVETRLRYLERLAAAARQAAPGQQFSLDGQRFTRIQAVTDQARPSMASAQHLRVRRDSDGEVTDLTQQEDEAFWTWAITETLRHTGIRIEELLELTHLALVTHTLPGTGEVVPLLQIVPSKQDAERVLLVSPELAHTLARIVHRLRDGSDRVPLVARYDLHERTAGPPLPHLFQRRYGTDRRVISPAIVKRLLDLAVERTGLRGPDGQPIRYTAHDFRRIFTTEAVAAGLPVHIAAKLLGHRDLNTTQGYAAVYQDDILRHHAAFIARRRAERPGEEYREPTAAEWAQFDRHFTRRKLELGTCSRPYGTPCRHEHACLRCPMLQPDPAQAQRLAEIITSLHERIREATERGWLGEAEGLQVSLTGARQKLRQIRQTRSRTTTVQISPRRP